MESREGSGSERNAKSEMPTEEDRLWPCRFTFSCAAQELSFGFEVENNIVFFILSVISDQPID